MMQTVSANELKKVLETSDTTVVCYFYANTSYSCKAFSSELAFVVEHYWEKYRDKVTFVKNDISEDGGEGLSDAYGIVSVPRVVVFKNGKPKASTFGFVHRDVLVKFIDQNL